MVRSEPYASAAPKARSSKDRLFDVTFTGDKALFDTFWGSRWAALGEERKCFRLASATPRHTANSENRLRDKAALEARLGLKEEARDADSDAVLHDKNGKILATGYVQVLYGDHGDYFELLERHVNWALFTRHKLKGPDRHYHEHYTEDGAVPLYDQFNTVANEPNPPPGAKSVSNNRKEGYADYRPGVIYMPTETVDRITFTPAAHYSSSRPAKDAPFFKELVRDLPKIELHQHLTGSMNNKSLCEELEKKGLSDLVKDLTPLNEANTDDKWNHLTKYCIACAKAAEWTNTEGADEKQQRFFKEAFDLLKQAGVVYCELRVGLKAEPTKHAYLERILQAVERVNSEGHLRISIIVSVARHAAFEYGKESAEVAMEFWKLGRPVCGIEIGGVPAKSNFMSDWLPVFQKAKDAGMPVALHCGEDKSDVKQEEWKGMIAFRPGRLGHCVLLDEANLQRLEESKIPVEVCLTCHEQHFSVPVKNNIFVRLKKSGHPMVLGTDNPSIYGISLVDEYALACETFGLSISELFALVRDGVNHVFLKDAAKEELREKMDKQISALEGKFRIC